MGTENKWAANSDSQFWDWECDWCRQQNAIFFNDHQQRPCSPFFLAISYFKILPPGSLDITRVVSIATGWPFLTLQWPWEFGDIRHLPTHLLRPEVLSIWCRGAWENHLPLEWKCSKHRDVNGGYDRGYGTASGNQGWQWKIHHL